MICSECELALDEETDSKYVNNELICYPCFLGDGPSMGPVRFSPITSSLRKEAYMHQKMAENRGFEASPL